MRSTFPKKSLKSSLNFWGVVSLLPHTGSEFSNLPLETILPRGRGVIATPLAEDGSGVWTVRDGGRRFLVERWKIRRREKRGERKSEKWWKIRGKRGRRKSEKNGGKSEGKRGKKIRKNGGNSDGKKGGKKFQKTAVKNPTSSLVGKFSDPALG